MDDLIVLWQSRPQLSLRRFAQYASVPYWRLRDYQHSAPACCDKQQHRDALYEKVRQAALQHPTSGYRMHRNSSPRANRSGCTRFGWPLGT